MINISIDEYESKVEHNCNLLLDVVKNKKPLGLLLSEVQTADSVEVSRHWSLLQPKWADIIPAVFLGHLPIINDFNGADGIRLDKNKNEFHEVEYKISTARSSKIDVGVKGGLCIKTKENTSYPTGITSAISAAYSIHSDNNLLTKNRETYLCLTDADNPEFHFVQCWSLSGHQAIAALNKSNKKQRSISLAVFINKGSEERTLVPSYTWELFKLNILRKKSPVLKDYYEEKYQFYKNIYKEAYQKQGYHYSYE